MSHKYFCQLMLPLFAATMSGEYLHQRILLLHADLISYTYMHELVEMFCNSSPMNSSIPLQLNVQKKLLHRQAQGEYFQDWWTQ